MDTEVKVVIWAETGAIGGNGGVLIFVVLGW